MQTWWEYDNQVTIDYMTDYCQHHHHYYAQVESPNPPASGPKALAAAAPGMNDERLNDQPAMPS